MTSIAVTEWVPGNHLRAADKAHALRVFTHRPAGISDQDWLNSHYFAIRRDGGLDLRVSKCKSLRGVM